MRRAAFNLDSCIRGLIFIGLYLYAAKTFALMPGPEEQHLIVIGLPCFLAATIAWAIMDRDLHPLKQSFLLAIVTAKLSFLFLFIQVTLYMIFLAFWPAITSPEKTFPDGFAVSDIPNMLTALLGGFFALLFLWLIAWIFNVLQSLIAAFLCGLIASFNPTRYFKHATRSQSKVLG